jgi:hypothetical protein
VKLPNSDQNQLSKGYLQLVLGVFLAVAFLFFSVLGFAYFFYRTSDGGLPNFREELSSNYAESAEDLETVNETPLEADKERCDVKFVDPILPVENETQTVAFDAAEGVAKGTLSRKVIGNTVYIEISVSGLDSGNKYVIHAVDVDDNNSICYSSVMGELTYVDANEVFVSGMYRMDADYVNDATLFVLTKDGFGLTGQELDSLSHGSVVTTATFLP